MFLPRTRSFFSCPRHLKLILLLSICCVGEATAVNIPATVNPGRIQNELSKTYPVPGVDSRTATGLGMRPSKIPKANQIRFFLNNIIIEGSSVYSREELLRPFRNRLGTSVSLADVEQFADLITTRYRDDGYVLSQAYLPPQAIKNGVVVIRIVEGYINHVSVEGDLKENDLLLEYAQKIRESRPLHVNTLERYSLLANDLPGVQVRTVIEPSKTVPGAADVTLVATQKYYEGYVSFDNRSSPYLGTQQLILGFNRHGVDHLGTTGGLRILTSQATNALRDTAFTYQMLLNSEGTRFKFDMEGTVTNPKGNLAPINLYGTGSAVNFDFTHPYIRERRRNIFLHVAFHYLNSKSRILNRSTLLFADRTRSLIFGVSGDFADKHQSIHSYSLDFSKGLFWLGCSDRESPFASRVGGRPDYFKMNGEYTYIHSLPYDLSVLMGTKGQYAFNSLLSGQQFGIGGAQYGRAYDPSEITGDYGLAGKVELRYDQMLRFPMIKGIQYFTFYDLGSVWNAKHDTSPARLSVSSAGIGFRSYFTDHFAMNFELDAPIIRGVASRYGKKEGRLFFGVSALV